MKKLLTLTLMLTVAAVVMATGIPFACDHGAGSGQAKTCPHNPDATMTMTSASGEKLVLLNISNMTDNAGATAVTKSLAAVSGVSDVVVSLKEGTAKVTVDPAVVKPESLTAAVEKVGYGAKIAPATTVVTTKAASATEEKKGATCGMQSPSCGPGK